MALSPKQAFEYAVAFGENRAKVAVALADAAERGEALTVREAQGFTDVSDTTVRNLLEALTRDDLIEETTKQGRIAFRMTDFGLEGFRAWRSEGSRVPATERRERFHDRLASILQEHVRDDPRPDLAKLPQAHRAVVEAEKLRDYVLSREHEHGRHKARVFGSALGIDRDNWEYLRDQIVSGVGDAEVTEVRSGRYGLRYSVPMLIEGLNGQTHEIITGWIVEEEGRPPRLTTAYVNVP